MADTVLTLLEPGEYVLNRNAVDAVGKENLDDLNYEEAPRFPEGSIMADYVSNQGIPAMSNGGSISYGGYESEQPTLNSLYEMFGVQPKNSDRFQEYDPTREGVYQEDYQTSMDKYRTGAASTIGDVYEKTSAMGGFGGSGKAEAVRRKAGKSIMDDYLQSQKSAYSTMFKGVRDERERYLKETGAQLTALEEAEGTKSYQAENPNINESPSEFDPNAGGWNPPQNPSFGTEYAAPDGQVYVYTERDGWMTAEEYRSNYDRNTKV
jgi:hypothetical protein